MAARRCCGGSSRIPIHLCPGKGNILYHLWLLLLVRILCCDKIRWLVPCLQWPQAVAYADLPAIDFAYFACKGSIKRAYLVPNVVRYETDCNFIVNI